MPETTQDRRESAERKEREALWRRLLTPIVAGMNPDEVQVWRHRLDGLTAERTRTH